MIQPRADFRRVFVDIVRSVARHNMCIANFTPPVERIHQSGLHLSLGLCRFRLIGQEIASRASSFIVGIHRPTRRQATRTRVEAISTRVPEPRRYSAAPDSWCRPRNRRVRAVVHRRPTNFHRSASLHRTANPRRRTCGAASGATSSARTHPSSAPPHRVSAPLPSAVTCRRCSAVCSLPGALRAVACTHSALHLPFRSSHLRSHPEAR